MKRVLIVTPYFPPVNAPDMQRVRMLLPYFRQNGWEPTVIAVDEKIAGGFRDELLAETIPADIELITVGAYPEKYTRKLGLGSISLRSLNHFRKAGNKALRKHKYDLVFFSTSQHHVCTLGRYWKKKFGVPFVIDMQDPWRNDFHVGKVKYNSSFKFRMAYRVNKYMEAYAMPYVDGLISVSQSYIDILKDRYPRIKNIPAKTVSFGASVKDFEVVKQHKLAPAIVDVNNGKTNVLYMGAVTPFFIPVIRLFFETLIDHTEDIGKYHFYFIGTSYAQGSKITMVADLAKELNITEHVTELADRVPYFNALATLQAADILFIPGSTDKDYNASKVYNNIIATTPIFCIFHKQSTVINAIEQAGAGMVCSFDSLDNATVVKEDIYQKWMTFLNNLNNYPSEPNRTLSFTSDNKAKEICGFFDTVIQAHQ